MHAFQLHRRLAYPDHFLATRYQQHRFPGYAHLHFKTRTACGGNRIRCSRRVPPSHFGKNDQFALDSSPCHRVHLPRHEPSYGRNVIGKPVFTGGLMLIVSHSESAQDGQQRLTLGRWPRVRFARTDLSRRRAELLFDAVASTRTPTFQDAYEYECRRSSP